MGPREPPLGGVLALPILAGDSGDGTDHVGDEHRWLRSGFPSAASGVSSAGSGIVRCISIMDCRPDPRIGNRCLFASAL
jgi:hypothetical protein